MKRYLWELIMGIFFLIAGAIDLTIMIMGKVYLSFYYIILPFLTGGYILLFRDSEMNYQRLKKQFANQNNEVKNGN